ncbi:DUF3696 domain-containing protein [Pantoea deleyi]|uniref:AAA family ATPase n=1 Tax=Pantoea deleyi TaxID=470932 RepID=UPI0035D4F604
MLNELFIKNFKSIEMQKPIKLNPFSILCGSNSSGKSSLIQSILMLSQSFSNRYQEDSITLNGPLVRLGSFEDIKKHSSKSEQITFAFSLPVNDKFFGHGNNRVFSSEITIGYGNKKLNKREEEYHPLILSNSVSISVLDENGCTIETDKVVISLNDKSNRENYYSVDCFDTSEKSRIALDYPDYQIIGCKGDLIPSTIEIEYDYIKKVSPIIINDLIDNNQQKKSMRKDLVERELRVLPKSFLLILVDLIKTERQEMYDSISVPSNIFSPKEYEDSSVDRDAIIKQIKDDVVDSTYILKPNIMPRAFFRDEFISLNDWKIFTSKLEGRVKKNLYELIDKNRNHLKDKWCELMPQRRDRTAFTSHVFLELEQILSFYFTRSVKYLGPLRMEPQAIYSSLGHYDPNSVGLKGEFTAAVLHKYREKSISYLSPRVLDGELFFEKRRKPLKTACLEWLNYLGVIEDFHTRDRGKLGYEINVKINKNESWQDLTHVGVGVSQVLPIVLMFLLSEEDDILIFEQPELHLHPQVQSRLCDLFIALAESGRQCIIETHSEYMINRLRLRIAQEDKSSIKDETSLYFITKDKGYSEFQPVLVNKYGSVIEWPKDFFDQTDREIERILYEASLKRKREKENGV